MADQKLNDVITYLETKAATLSDIDTTTYTDFDSQPPPVKTYGIHMFLEDDFKEDERRHIGPSLTETFKIRLNIIINRRLKDRDSVSDSKGISHWIYTVTELLKNGTNSGAFDDSYWELTGLNPSQDMYIIEGVFTCEILNKYA